MNEQIQEFLEAYQDFLRSRGYSESTIRTYTRKLRKYLNSNYSVNDLIGDADRLIEQHSKGGQAYRAADHGNTVNALKRLNDFVLSEYTDTFYLSKQTNFGVWIPKTKAIVRYEIDHTRHITITYNTGAQVRKRVPDATFYALLKLLRTYKKYLCKDLLSALAAPAGFDMPSHDVELVFGDIHLHRCATLFADGTPTRILNHYGAIINSLCS